MLLQATFSKTLTDLNLFWKFMAQSKIISLHIIS